MATTAAYDEIADWYETRFLAAQAEGDPLGVARTLDSLLGTGTGPGWCWTASWRAASRLR